uniref:(northern house mosquito) hypothetical protein n=1 Tax=Culex pipiens TaxID=7175 RepID=A0A8D8K5D8_CULPI
MSSRIFLNQEGECNETRIFVAASDGTAACFQVNARTCFPAFYSAFWSRSRYSFNPPVSRSGFSSKCFTRSRFPRVMTTLLLAAFGFDHHVGLSSTFCTRLMALRPFTAISYPSADSTMPAATSGNDSKLTPVICVALPE